jgi:succinyl-diaminopimelate desuccinylase
MPETALDLTLDAPVLTAALVDFPSVSGAEKPLADAIEEALRELPHLTVDRHGNNVVARTRLGHPERVATTTK